jgi:hypothetical protein
MPSAGQADMMRLNKAAAAAAAAAGVSMWHGLCVSLPCLSLFPRGGRVRVKRGGLRLLGSVWARLPQARPRLGPPGVSPWGTGRFEAGTGRLHWGKFADARPRATCGGRRGGRADVRRRPRSGPRSRQPRFDVGIDMNGRQPCHGRKKRAGGCLSADRCVCTPSHPYPRCCLPMGRKLDSIEGADEGEGNPLVCVARPCVRFAESRYALFQPHASSRRRLRSFAACQLADRSVQTPPAPARPT